MAEVVVEYDYQAKEPDELTIKKGDIIKDVAKRQGGWWEGVLNEKKGMFPDNFVRCVDTDPVILRGRKDVARIRQCRVVFSYSRDHEDELDLKVGDVIDVVGEEEEGWWRGVLDGREGVFPSNFVEVVEKQARPRPNVREDLEARSVGDGVVPSLPAKPVKQLCEVKYSYKAQNDDELSLKEGDVVTLLSKEAPDAGWWKGELNGKTGVFPDNFVVLIANHDDKTGKEDKRPQSQPSPTPPLGAPKPTSVASQRKSLEAKEERKPADKAAAVEPKATPPVPGKKPVVSLKKSPSGSGSGLFSEFKKKLVDVVDGASGSRPKSEPAPAQEANEADNAFDQVERRPLLQDVRASRAKAPGRRPTKSVHKEEEAPAEVNGTADSSETESQLNSSSELDAAENKPKLREWEKHKAPWLEEMKLNQAKRSSTSPGPEPKLKLTPAPAEPDELKSAKTSPAEREVSPVDMSKSVGAKPRPAAPSPTKPKVSPVSSRPPKPPEKPPEAAAGAASAAVTPSAAVTASAAITTSAAITASAAVTAEQYNELVETVRRLETVVERQQRSIEELRNKLQVETDMRMMLQEKIAHHVQV